MRLLGRRNYVWLTEKTITMNTLKSILSSGIFWTAVGSIAAVVAVIVAIIALLKNRKNGPQGIDHKGKAYRLGFTVSKLVWHHGAKQECQNLAEQFRAFAVDLSLPNRIVKDVLKRLPSLSTLDEILKKGNEGIKVRDSLSGILEARHNSKIAKAFRLGFGIVNILPQLEFFEKGRESNLPIKEFVESLNNQIENLAKIARDVGVGATERKAIEKMKDSLSNPAGLRVALITTGGKIDKSLNQT
jgi:hypothetical protein